MSVSSSGTRLLCHGDVIDVFGRTLVWDEFCVSQSTAQRWRSEGDPLCDAALNELFANKSPAGIDLLARLESDVSDRPLDSDSPSSRFWAAINELPPENIRVTERDIELARSFFIDHSVQIMQALLYYSLAGGFASPRIVRTLDKVSYLVHPSSSPKNGILRDRTFRRLQETFQFVLEVMRCVVPAPEDQGSSYLLPGGDGWKSTIRVRMLHGVARAKASRRGTDSSMLNEVPISQEDMSATTDSLASFSTVPLWALNQLGLPPSKEEAEAYLALWKHVGFYMGVSPAILSRYFSDTCAADQFLLSMVIHLFVPDEEEMRDFVPPTVSVLSAVVDRPPFRSTFEYNCAIARYLLGPRLANHLLVPETSWPIKIRLQLVTLLQAYPVIFSKIYGRTVRGSWLKKRRFVYGVGMAMMLRRSLGMRKTKFRFVEGELDQTAWDDEAVKPDYDTGQLLAQYWRQVLFEMFAITIGASVVAGYACWRVFSWISRY